MNKQFTSISQFLAQPDELHTVLELREELARSNRLVLDVGQQLYSLTRAVHNTNVFLDQLVSAHKAGDPEKVAALLDMVGKQSTQAPAGPIH
ncbi:hypothetical protein [Herbaspirillum sp.]|uniref:hypothetical protein n=1 Tax=Herbaspirillum sp. TaxID=1890675 RepID=UPI001B2E386A|nr:hypothetical protein [Herbaspirillum sp.]MBO9538752.1 hypothetical protein [Herbaspirillum sp.]